MTLLQAQIPDFLYRQIEEFARKESLPLDEVVALALSAQLSAWSAANYVEQRARRGSWESARAVLDRVPDIEPEPQDRIH
jgi:hypothetical protein